jgi:hypothetical protein
MGVYKNKNPITSCLMFHKNLYASIAWIFIKHNKHLQTHIKVLHVHNERFIII